MSGLEVAGVVLGAIPLVIAAVEHYEKVTDPMKVFLKFKGEISKVIRELGSLRVSYELSLKVVLLPIVQDQELIEMTENPQSDLWQEPLIDTSLRSSLGEAYSAYIRTTEDIRSAIVEILGCLDIQDSSKASGDKHQEHLDQLLKREKNSGLQIKQRLKFSKSRKRVQTRLVDIRRYIVLLDSYAEKTAKISASEPADGPSRFRFARSLKVLQSNATKLYDVLSRSWCSTHSSHPASLLLEQRIVPIRRGKRSLGDCDTSRFIISVPQTLELRKDWLDVEFRLTEEDSQATSQKKTQVQISITTNDPKDSAPIPPYNDPSRLQAVNDLCRALQSCGYTSVGFCFDGIGCLRGAYDAQRQNPVNFHDNAISLCDLLQPRKYQLSLRDKYILAITLASTLLQLSPSQWLCETWSKSDILFLRVNDNEMSDIPIDIAHPYLLHEHTVNPAAQKQQLAGGDSSKLLSLGVILVEIFSSRPIEAIHHPEDLGPNNKPSQLTDLNAVKRWLRSEGSLGNISLSCFDAIQYCLECFTKPAARLEDEEFAGTVLNKVLMPLLVEFNSMFLRRM